MTKPLKPERPADYARWRARVDAAFRAQPGASGLDDQAIDHLIFHADPAALPNIDFQLRRWLLGTIMVTLRDRVGDRPPSARELADELRVCGWTMPLTLVVDAVSGLHSGGAIEVRIVKIAECFKADDSEPPPDFGGRAGWLN